jgi:hypothetical protein
VHRAVEKRARCEERHGERGGDDDAIRDVRDGSRDAKARRLEGEVAHRGRVPPSALARSARGEDPQPFGYRDANVEVGDG